LSLRNTVLNEGIRELDAFPVEEEIQDCKVATTSMKMPYIEFPSGPSDINREGDWRMLRTGYKARRGRMFTLLSKEEEGKRV
jgi:hypothetical protein